MTAVKMAAPEDTTRHYAVLTGGIGGAKLALGLQEILPAGELTAIVNTGDDFEHLGLLICPDVDTLLYTLAGSADPQQGWGLGNESWACMERLESLGGAAWFRLGDRDLATHLRRRELLTEGLGLSAVTARLREALGVATTVLPMSDDAVRTIVDTRAGPLAFQEYFVRLRAEPEAEGFRYTGAETAAGATDALDALAAESLCGIFIAPSNPWLSIDPILAVSDIKNAVLASSAPVVAVSPIVGGRAIKGPTAKLMRELGIAPTVVGIADHYRGIIDGLIIDREDAVHSTTIESMGMQVTITNTILQDLADKAALATHAIDFAAQLAERAA